MNERGFTLLEMLVALAVIGVAALTLVRLDAFAVRSSADLDARTLAQLVAQNEAVTLWTDAAPPTIGTGVTTAENAGQRFRIERRVAPTADANLLRIDLIVRADPGPGEGGADYHPARQVKDRGFTLVEMLVALSIFAVIASIGVGLLRASVDTQGAVQDRLGAMGAINRLRAVMANDLAQAALRPSRGPDGSVRPAFVGTAQGFALVHRGRVAIDGDGEPMVQRVEYRLAEGEWQRATAPRVDGAPMGEGDALARDVSAVTLRYRGARGDWLPDWSSEREGRLPTAVELALTRGGRAPLLLRFQTGPVLAPPRLPEVQP